jgi:hypothetical protein
MLTHNEEIGVIVNPCGNVQVSVPDWIMLCRAITKMPIIYEDPYAYSVFSGVK